MLQRMLEMDVLTVAMASVRLRPGTALVVTPSAEGRFIRAMDRLRRVGGPVLMPEGATFTEYRRLPPWEATVPRDEL